MTAVTCIKCVVEYAGYCMSKIHEHVYIVQIDYESVVPMRCSQLEHFMGYLMTVLFGESGMYDDVT